MNYSKQYELLIKNRVDNPIVNGEYTEKHHILPKSMGGSNGKHNIVSLTAREHFVAHKLLYKIHGGVMAYAYFCLVGYRTELRKEKLQVSSLEYEKARLAFVEAKKEYFSKNDAHNKGKKYDAATRENMGAPKGVTPWNLGRKWSDEVKSKISSANKGKEAWNKKYNSKREAMDAANARVRMSDEAREEWKKGLSEKNMGSGNPMFGNGYKLEGSKNGRFGKPASEDTKRKISERLKNQKKYKCPHCDVVGCRANMNRWHFDNCKHRDKIAS